MWDVVPKVMMVEGADKICECGRVFTDDSSSGPTCFPCKLKGIRFNWVGGGGYGRKAFHDKTFADVHRETHRNAKRAGVTLEKVSTRAVLV